jgi:hypothetical protein
MLVSLEIRNFLLIKKLSINLIKGFNTFTGETGAGKSILGRRSRPRRLPRSGVLRPRVARACRAAPVGG